MPLAKYSRQDMLPFYKYAACLVKNKQGAAAPLRIK